MLTPQNLPPPKPCRLTAQSPAPLLNLVPIPPVVPLPLSLVIAAVPKPVQALAQVPNLVQVLNRVQALNPVQVLNQDKALNQDKVPIIVTSTSLAALVAMKMVMVGTTPVGLPPAMAIGAIAPPLTLGALVHPLTLGAPVVTMVAAPMALGELALQALAAQTKLA